jgi:hypothetical protein
MHRKKHIEVRRPAPASSDESKTVSAPRSLQRLSRAFAVIVALFIASLAAAAYVCADWYYGVPENAEAAFVGRQSCVECHQSQHSAWQGSHHDLAMDRAAGMTVLGDFNNAELTHHGVTSRMFKKDDKFFVNTEGPDGKLSDFEVKYVFGVDPLQQYMVEFDRPADITKSGFTLIHPT